MNKKIKNISKTLPLIMFLSVNIFATGTQATSGFGGAIQGHVYTMFMDYFRPGVQAALFLWAAWDVIQGFVGRDKKTSWTNVIMILGAIAILGLLPTLWNTIANTTFGS